MADVVDEATEFLQLFLPVLVDDLPPQLIDLDPINHPQQFNATRKEFYDHTRVPDEYTIQGIQLLKNNTTHRRYVAEKYARLPAPQQPALQKSNDKHNKRANPPTAVPLLPRKKVKISDLLSTSESLPAFASLQTSTLFQDHILFHGTQKRNIPSILKNGLDPRLGHRPHRGAGVYFSDSIEKCMRYVDTQTSMEQEYSIIMCAVLLGNVFVEAREAQYRQPNKETFFPPEGFDSVVIENDYHEWVVYEKSQILPLCVIHFKASNCPRSYLRLSTATQRLASPENTVVKVSVPALVCSIPAGENAPPHRIPYPVERTWYTPDAAMASMLNTLFEIPIGTSRVMWTYVTGSRLVWMVNTDAGVVLGIMDGAIGALLCMAKNIGTLEAIQAQACQSFIDVRRVQQQTLDRNIDAIPNNSLLMQKLMDMDSEVGKRFQAVIDWQASLYPAVRDSKCKKLGAQYGRAAAKLKRAEEDLVQILPSLSPWSLEQAINASKALRERHRLRAQEAIHKMYCAQQEEALKSETKRQREWAQSMIMKEIQEINWEGGPPRRFIHRLGHVPMDFADRPLVFATIIQEINVDDLQVWPQVCVDRTQPRLNIMGVAKPDDKLQNPYHASVTSILARVSGPHLRGFHDPCHPLSWWDMIPMITTQLPTASSKFWPVDPRTRLFNRRFTKMTDYLEWIVQKDGPISGKKLSDSVDPWTLSALCGLSSRSGNVVFKRQLRKSEMDATTSEMFSDLVVNAQSIGWASVHDDECPICKEAMSMNNPVSTTVKIRSCKHCFHERCIEEWFRCDYGQFKCPICNVPCQSSRSDNGTGSRLRLGPMPDGSMGYTFDAHFSCYFVLFSIPPHTIPDPADPEHKTITVPRTTRSAIIPFTARLGPLIMIRLICAFYYGHIFRVGQSLTTGNDNVVVWNGIHMRTSFQGSYGFPAPDFERTCWEELNQKCIALGFETLILRASHSNKNNIDTIEEEEGCEMEGIQTGPIQSSEPGPGISPAIATQRLFAASQPMFFASH
ncbi:hypothetical protein BG011_002575 [Mortierella polycephala]|uniref:RING-type E3 ubiquitin transferase n=1 Tax=Mortierella polycephala TaxID=41804 RepID=A0A9P6Q468_9FUNG|nr:hypothetical protein BG011_002575 [Mortierella polycephala]